jgi:membrane-bound serine protease (ClpP class)
MIDQAASNPGGGGFVMALLVFVAAAFVVVIAVALTQLGKKRVSGLDDLSGMEGTAITDLDPGGQVRISGETWSARAREGSIPAGSAIVVREKKGLTLIVEKTG